MALIQYIFTPPTKWEGPAGDDNLFYRFRLERGLSVLKLNGAYYLTTYPSTDDVAAADIAYLGGYNYRIDQAEKDALTAAGYGSYCVQIDGAWGLNGYGEGPYGGPNNSLFDLGYGEGAYGFGPYGGGLATSTSEDPTYGGDPFGSGTYGG